MSSRGNSWSEEETLCLLGIWKDQKIQDQLDGTVRNNVVMRKIMEMMAESGYERTATQVKNKMKKLRESFRQAEDNNRTSGRGRKTCRYHHELEEILGGRPETEPVAVIASVELEAPPETTGNTDDAENTNIQEELYDHGSDHDTDSASEAEKDATPQTPPEIVGDFFPEEIAGQSTPRTAKSKGTKRKKSKMQQSLEWMGKQMRFMDQESARRFQVNEEQHRQEHFKWERELARNREELEERRRREDREFQERERERDRQHQLQILQVAASAFQMPMSRNGPIMQRNTETMPAQPDSYSLWDQAGSGPSYTTL